MSKPTEEQLQKAIQTITDYGRESFIDEIKDRVSDAECFGNGMSGANQYPTFMMEAAAAHCTDWNYHEEAKAIKEMLG